MKTPRFFSILAVTMLSSLSIAMLSSACFAQTVSNVRFEQVDNKVKITYSLDEQANISVCISEDGGKTWSSPLKIVSGDVGKNIQAGENNSIWWDVLSEYGEFIGTNICFKVVAVDRKDLIFTVNGQTFTMVYVQGGLFMMGDSTLPYTATPIHPVTLSDYYIGKYEVTRGLWKAVVGSDPSMYYHWNKKNADDYPVENVSWQDCQSFISKLNILLSDQLGDKRFALPTEAQWEYAARGGDKSKGYKYAGSNLCSAVAWYPGNSCFLGLWYLWFTTTRPVGKKKPNELGLYDMSGNVAEFCFDVWYEYTPPKYDCNKHVVRGGCFKSERKCNFRVSYRSFFDHTIGLRLVLIQ